MFESEAKFAVILPAAGKGSRFHDKNYKKPFVPLADRAVWLHTVEKFTNRKDVAQTIVVISPDDREMFTTKFGANLAILGVNVVDGGAERADSVMKALEQVDDDVQFVAIHDAVRPCIADEWIDAVFEKAKETSAAILGVPVISTLKQSGAKSTIAKTVPRESLWEAQTPQVFAKQLLVDAYAKRKNNQSTDDAQLVEALGHEVAIVPGSRLNIKITTREDLKIAAAFLKLLPKPKLGGGNPFAGDDMWR